MKTKLLYHENSFIYECSAKVVSVDGDEVVLDATVFFPGGGGKMADHGTISWNDYQIEANVIAMNKRDDVVWHTLSCTPPPVGTEVVGTIDWDFRYRMMRTHTALHILCGTIWKEFGVQVTGGQMYPDRARMDFAKQNQYTGVNPPSHTKPSKASQYSRGTPCGYPTLVGALSEAGGERRQTSCQ